MTQFDILLRRALMDANLAQYERALQSAEARDPDFSPGYLRERMRLLAAPQGWGRQARPGARKRLNWRLVAIVAALLLLSACAYAVATGQFSQWFTWFGVNPNAPEQSEEVLRRTGTVIEQSQTVGDTTLTLNAAVWDGTYIYLSFTIESPSLPEDLQAYTPLHTGDCRLIMRQDQWEEYMTNRVKEDCANQNMTPEETEEAVRAALEEGDRKDVVWLFCPETREGNVLSVQIRTTLFSRWFTETIRPELTLHLENIAVYADGKGETIIDENGYAQNPGPGEIVIPGPFDLTFTLNEPILPIHYGGADVDVTLGTPPLREVPMHFTELQLSVTGMDLKGEILAQVDMTPQEGYVEAGLPEGGKESDPLRMVDVQFAIFEGPWGLWIEDGTYVDIMDGGLTTGSDRGETFEAFISHSFPYPIDPATITAVDIGGVRVELSELERLPERIY